MRELIERLRGLADALRRRGYPDNAALVDEAAAALEAAREDAERYRWLRDARCGSGDGEVEILIWRGERGGVANDADRDLGAAIDQARGKAGQAVGE